MNPTLPTDSGNGDTIFDMMHKSNSTEKEVNTESES